MPRRGSLPKRAVEPDPKYNNINVALFVNRLMHHGKKSVARSVVYDAFDLIEQRAKRNPVEVFEQALRNVTPRIEVKSRRVGGANYQVPVEVDPYRANSLAMRWILSAARARGGRGTPNKLASELMDASQGQGNAVRRKEETHRMAEANRTFAHYRF